MVRPAGTSPGRPSRRPLSRSELWYGRAAPLPPVRALRAGPLEFELDGVDLARVRWGSTELVNRVYMSVRDRNWDTVLPLVSALLITRRAGDLEVTFRAHNRAGEIDLEWRGTITATADGRIDYEMRGTALSDFAFCRIGFCVLHSEVAAAGRRYRAVTPDGVLTGTLPRLIAPQEIVDGRELALIPPCSSLEVQLDGVAVRTSFEGSLFSAEDQRNWTDASFKTCCVAGSDYPYPAERGRTFVQRVSLTTTGRPPERVGRASRIQRIEVGESTGAEWPAIGLGIPAGSDGLARREASRLAGLGLDHLRLDLHLASSVWSRTLARAATTAAAVGARLEIALYLDLAAGNQLAQLAVALVGLPVGRLIVLPEWTPAVRTTPPGLIETVRLALEPAHAVIPLVGGTDGDFAELNRDRPSTAAWDGVAWSINPQVHAFDDRSLVETLATQATTVETARSFAGSTPAIVSPITLRQRFNPSAIGDPTEGDGDLPSWADPRQMSLFGAGWTLGSIASLCAVGAASLTYHDTVGWRGVMETERGSASAAFPSRPRMAYPMFHVFADLADRRTMAPIAANGADKDAVASLAMRHGGRVRILVANLTPSRSTVAVGPLSGTRASVRVLDEKSAAVALATPSRFRRVAEPAVVRNGQARCVLAPFAYLWLEGADGR